MTYTAFPLVLLLLQLSADVNSGCRFPSGVQTNRTVGPARDWVGHVREQFTDVGVQIVVAGNVLRVTATNAAPRRSYTLVCLQVRLHTTSGHSNLAKAASNLVAPPDE